MDAIWRRRDRSPATAAVADRWLFESLCIHLDFDAEMVDEILQRLSLLRAKMLPVPRRS